MKQRWLDLTLQRPWLVLLLGILFVFAAGFGSKNLYFRGDYRVFFEPDNPQRVAYEEMQDVFSKNENATIVIAPKSGNVFTTETLSLVKELTDAAWQTPLSYRVDSITNFQHTWSVEDDMMVEDLVPSVSSLSQEGRIERVRRVAMQEPNLAERLISADGRVTAVNITVNLPEGNSSAAVAEISNYVIALSEQFSERYPNHDFYHTGIVFMNNSFATSAQSDAETLVPLMFLAIVFMMWVLLKSISGTIATVAIIIITIISTMGIAGWTGFFLSTASVNVPTLVMTLAVADCIHVIATMTYGLRQGMDKKEALEYSMRLNVMPIFVTSFTTAIGFATLNFASVPIIRDLGTLTALGAMLAFAFSVVILPAMLMLLPMRTNKLAESKSQFMENFGDWVVKHHRALLPATFALCVGVGAFTFTNQINDIATDYFDKSTPFRQSTDFQTDNLSGMSTVDFALFTEEESGVNNPQTLKHVEAFANWLREQPEVDHVVTITDTFNRLNKNMHGDDESYYRLPEDKELAAQYLLLYEMSLPYGLDLNNQLNIDKSATRVSVTMQNLGSKEFTGFDKRAHQWVKDNAPALRITSGSPNIMFAYVGEENMASMIEGTLLALLIISLLLVFALRSWRMGAISLLPNLLPAAVGFGIWGIFNGQINMGLSVVMSMSLGIIVDDTVHFLSKYWNARKEGMNAEQAVRFAFSNVGRALWITTLVLTVGFSVLAMSVFLLNEDMGKLTAIIIVVALAIDFLFLPSFLMVFDKKHIEPTSKKPSTVPPAVGADNNDHQHAQAGTTGEPAAATAVSSD